MRMCMSMPGGAVAGIMGSLCAVNDLFFQSHSLCLFEYEERAVSPQASMFLLRGEPEYPILPFLAVTKK